jgi:2-polyprenyl-3-methyl-5-hydroxy-6-metoxy-1,4-benzoquinol methylase
MNQNKYYSEFALKYRDEIINSGDPSLWTTDISTNGPISVRMKVRLNTLKEVINEHFSREHRVLDFGCGFGRQAFLLAKEGFKITGVDTNPDFIDIANELFEKHSLEGIFYCINEDGKLADQEFKQIILLEVLEHIPPSKRKKFINSVRSVCSPESKLIISVPKVKPTFKFWLLNFSKFFLSWFFMKEEHPYHIPDEKSINRILGKHFKVTTIATHDETVFYLCKS